MTPWRGRDNGSGGMRTKTKRRHNPSDGKKPSGWRRHSSIRYAALSILLLGLILLLVRVHGVWSAARVAPIQELALEGEIRALEEAERRFSRLFPTIRATAPGLLTRAVLHFERGEVSRAVAFCNIAMRRDRAYVLDRAFSSRVSYVVAACHYEQEQWDASAAFFEKSIEQGFRIKTAALNRAVILLYRLSHTDPGRAAELLEAAVSAPGESLPAIHHHLGIAYRLTGRFAEAERQHRKALDLADSRELPRALAALAMDLESLGQMEEARKLAERSAHLDASFAYAWLILGRLASQRGDNEACLGYLRRALAGPADVARQARYLFGRELVRSGREEAGAAVLREHHRREELQRERKLLSAHGHAPGDSGLLRLVDIEFELGRLEGAAKLIEALPALPEAALRGALLAHRQGKREEALALADRLPETLKENQEYLALRASILLEVNRAEEALQFAEVLLSHGDARGLLFLGRAHEGLSQTTAAKEAYKKALSSPDTETVARRRLARLFINEGHHGEAHRVLEPLVYAPVADPDSLELLAECLSALGEAEQSAHWLGEARVIREIAANRGSSPR